MIFVLVVIKYLLSYDSHVFMLFILFNCLLMKKFFLFLLGFLFSIGITFSNQYALFYWIWCPHCEKVRYFLQQKELSWYIIQKEVYYHTGNQQIFSNVLKKLSVPSKESWVPFLLIHFDTWYNYVVGDTPIIDYVSQHIDDVQKSWKFDFTDFLDEDIVIKDFWKFLWILIPAALSDSINPCAFAVMLILLWAILTRYKKKWKVILAGCLFTLSIFISYFLMWIGFYRAFASASNTVYLKLWIWILWIIVWLANLKDAFWYWKLFVMEVPLSWRPKMKKFLNTVTSPIWAFFVGFVISLFLLPCTSWPYVTILWYLASESANINKLWYMYLFIYNLIFVLPMIVITILVSGWVYTAEQLSQKKDKYIRLIHFIVWILMLWLWIYVIFDSGVFHFSFL